MKKFLIAVVAVCVCFALCACDLKQLVQSGNPNQGITEVDDGKEYADTISGYVLSGDYSAAIQYYNSLSNSVKKMNSVAAAYNNAVSAYMTDVMQRVNNYIATGDFTAAKSVLTVAGNLIGNDTRIDAKIKEVKEQELLKQVIAYEAQGNYEAAISYLNSNSSIVSNSVDLQVKLETYKEKYRAQVIARAADAYKNNGVNEALSVLNNALKVLHNDSALSAEKERYEKAIPVSLLDINITKKGDYISVGSQKSKIYTDVSGKTYNNEKILYRYRKSTMDRDLKNEDSISFYLNEEYDILTGSIYLPYVTLECEFNWTSAAYFEIYGDGHLLYTSPNVTQKTVGTIDFSVEVSGVRELTFVIKGWWQKDQFSEHNPKLCIANLQVAKEP